MLKTIYFSLFLFFAAFLNAEAQTEDAKKLLSDMDEIIFGPVDKQGKVKIVLTSKSGKGKIREAIMLQKGTDKKLFRYTQPETQAGIATLSLPDDVMWLYMPAIGTKKISILAKSGAFSGTDFSYEDMATKPYSDRFDPVFLEANDLGFLLQLNPKPEEKTQYSKILVTLEKQNHYPKLMEYFDRGGNKFKEATYTYKKIGKYWNADEVVMTNLRKGHQTRIQLTEMQFDQGLDDELFNVENLKPPKGDKDEKEIE